ncbi:MAG: hypothetical protein ACI9GW_003063 [Halieaceae bacterium]|jgi:hypothetical protein
MMQRVVWSSSFWSTTALRPWELSIIVFLCGATLHSAGQADAVETLGITPWDHLTVVATSEEATVDYRLGLGPLQKLRGRWQHKSSEELQGRLQGTTWVINPGYSTEDALGYLKQEIQGHAELGAEILYRCSGLTCGSSAEWANTVFSQRLLYGRDVTQSYLAMRASNGEGELRIVLYAAQRSSNRQYVHLDVLSLAAKPL